jgi:hypothetical protein
VIGISCLAVSLLLGDGIASVLRGRRVGELLRESLLIGGWVAMWRPLEIFLYDWWPIRAEAKLFDRLSAMPVRIAYTQDASSEAWRWDWPAVPAGERPSGSSAPQEASKAQRNSSLVRSETQLDKTSALRARTAGNEAAELMAQEPPARVDR